MKNSQPQTTNEIFSWQDFKDLDLSMGPETLAYYCNRIVFERTTRLRLCQHVHDVVREDAGFTQEFLNGFPYRSVMLRPWKINE